MTDKIASHKDYLAMLAQMDMLFDDYDANKLQIDLLAPLLEQYETNAAYFSDFNQLTSGHSPSRALLQVLMDQHGLAINDFADVLGGLDQVTAVLDGQGTLTPEQLSALSNRFGFASEAIFES